MYTVSHAASHNGQWYALVALLLKKGDSWQKASTKLLWSSLVKGLPLMSSSMRSEAAPAPKASNSACQAQTRGQHKEMIRTFASEV